MKFQNCFNFMQNYLSFKTVLILYRIAQDVSEASYVILYKHKIILKLPKQFCIELR